MLDPTKPLAVVDVSDTNLDESMDKLSYAQTFNPELIKHKPGKKARVFWLRPLPKDAFFAIDDNFGALPARQREAFRVAIQKIEQPDNSTVNVPQENVSYMRCTDEFYNGFISKYGARMVYILGALAYRLAREPETNPFLE